MWTLSEGGHYRSVDIIAGLAAVIEAVARLAAGVDWAWKAEIERHYRTDPTVGIIVCGFHRNVDTTAEIRWWALSDYGHHYRKVQSVLVARLAMVVDCGHFPIKSARAVFAGPLMQFRHYLTVGIIVSGFHRNVDTIAEMRWWALSDCGHYRRGTDTIAKIQR